MVLKLILYLEKGIPDMRDLKLMKLEQIQARYNQGARWYEFASIFLDLIILGRLRRQIFSPARGKILEVAAGNGKNLPFYPRASAVTAIDISQAMLKYASRRAEALGLRVEVKVADAQNLPFADNSFDTVSSSLTTCTFPDPLVAIKEMKRVCRLNGQILLLEHGRSRVGWIARRQDRKAARYGPNFMGCYPNRDPEKLVKEAGLTLTKVERLWGGYFYLITARP